MFYPLASVIGRTHFSCQLITIHHPPWSNSTPQDMDSLPCNASMNYFPYLTQGSINLLSGLIAIYHRGFLRRLCYNEIFWPSILRHEGVIFEDTSQPTELSSKLVFTFALPSLGQFYTHYERFALRRDQILAHHYGYELPHLSCTGRSFFWFGTSGKQQHGYWHKQAQMSTPILGLLVYILFQGRADMSAALSKFWEEMQASFRNRNQGYKLHVLFITNNIGKALHKYENDADNSRELWHYDSRVSDVPAVAGSHVRCLVESILNKMTEYMFSEIRQAGLNTKRTVWKSIEGFSSTASLLSQCSEKSKEKR